MCEITTGWDHCAFAGTSRAGEYSWEIRSWTSGGTGGQRRWCVSGVARESLPLKTNKHRKTHTEEGFPDWSRRDSFVSWKHKFLLLLLLFRDTRVCSYIYRTDKNDLLAMDIQEKCSEEVSMEGLKDVHWEPSSSAGVRLWRKQLLLLNLVLAAVARLITDWIFIKWSWNGRTYVKKVSEQVCYTQHTWLDFGSHSIHSQFIHRFNILGWIYDLQNPFINLKYTIRFAQGSLQMRIKISRNVFKEQKNICILYHMGHIRIGPLNGFTYFGFDTSCGQFIIWNKYRNKYIASAVFVSKMLNLQTLQSGFHRDRWYWVGLIVADPSDCTKWVTSPHGHVGVWIWHFPDPRTMLILNICCSIFKFVFKLFTFPVRIAIIWTISYFIGPRLQWTQNGLWLPPDFNSCKRLQDLLQKIQHHLSESSSTLCCYADICEHIDLEFQDAPGLNTTKFLEDDIKHSISSNWPRFVPLPPNYMGIRTRCIGEGVGKGLNAPNEIDLNPDLVRERMHLQ